MLDKAQEIQLVKDCLKNNRIAQNKLYKHFSGQMMGLCMRYSSCKADAEDILQEGFFQVFRDLKQYKKEAPLGGWIRKVIIHTALRQLRKKKNLYPMLEIENVQDRISGAAEIYSKLGRDELLVLIQELPTGARTVFNLFAVEAFSHQEIAELLGISEGTSKSQFARAKKLLKEKMQNLKIQRIASNRL